MILPLFVVLTAYIDDEYLCRLLFSVLMSAQLNDTLESHRTGESSHRRMCAAISRISLGIQLLFQPQIRFDVI